MMLGRLLQGGTLVSIILVASILVWAGESSAASRRPTRVKGELLIQTRAGMTNDHVEASLRRHGAHVIDEIGAIRVKRIKVPARSLSTIKAALARNRNFTFVEYNYFAESSVSPNDTYFASQWHLPKISAPQGWDISTGAAGVTIAIADSGVDPTHPDLAGKLLPGYNFYDGNADSSDVYGHGTKVAGAAAAATNNAAGVAGVAWANPIMPLRVGSATGSVPYFAMAKAITYAADHGVRVVNLSCGGTSASSTLDNAVNYAWNKGTIVIASAGNYGNSTPVYPAACDKAVAVAATTSSDVRASFSSYGDWVDLSAPGSGIYTTVRGGGYGSVSGTSFSSPITAGLAALVIGANPSLTNAQVVGILEANADDLGLAGFDPYYGHGRINVEKSLQAAVQTPVQTDILPPTAELTSPASGVSYAGRVPVQASATDNIGVAQVELYVDGSLYAETPTAPYSFLWDTTTVADGTHVLEALARDGAGNEGWSARLTVSVRNVADTTAPSVSITAPADGATVGRKTTVVVRAADNIGVARTELYIDGILKASSSNGTLSYSWNTLKTAAGAHALTARSYDAAGLEGTATITVYK